MPVQLKNLISSHQTRMLLLLFGLPSLTIFVLLIWKPSETSSLKLLPIESSPTAFKISLPKPNTKEGFVSSQACRSCHPDQYASWYKTYHRTMTQAATPEAVLPEWDNVKLESRGRTYVLERRGDEFWVDMVDPSAEVRAFIQGVELTSQSEIPRVERQIAMTTGSHHHQTYSKITTVPSSNFRGCTTFMRSAGSSASIRF